MHRMKIASAVAMLHQHGLASPTAPHTGWNQLMLLQATCKSLWHVQGTHLTAPDSGDFSIGSLRMMW